MSATNLGDQYITFDYRHPAKGSDFNTLLREGITPGVYKGGLITYSGTEITIAPFVIYINTGTDKLVRVETRANTVLTVTESTPVIALTYTWQDVSEDWLDFNQRASGSGALTNEVCLGECVFGGGVITSITYASKTWGKKFTNDVPIGTAPFVITSTTKVTNLNADLLDDKHVGSSGNTIPLLDQNNTISGTNTFSALQTFTVDPQISNTSPGLIFADTTASAYDFKIMADTDVLYLCIDTASDTTFETANPISSLYTGTSNTNTDYPLGTTVLCQTGGVNIDRNASNAIKYSTVSTYVFVHGADTGVALSGTWRSRGTNTHSGHTLFQRTE